MTFRERVTGAFAIAVVLALAALQFASDGIYSRAAMPRSLSAHVSADFGERVYGAIERIARLAFVEDMLADAALQRGDLQAAQLHVDRMRPSQIRSDLAARIALARGDAATAEREFLAAVNVPAIQGEVDRLQARGDLQHAYDLEDAIRGRLTATATHPDAVGESYWRSGELATALARRNSARRGFWMQTGLTDYRKALLLAPFSEKYLLAAGTQELNMRNDTAASAYFQRGIEVDPQSADSYAGLGVVALHQGNRAAAESFAQRSRALDPNSEMLVQLESELH